MALLARSTMANDNDRCNPVYSGGPPPRFALRRGRLCFAWLAPDAGGHDVIELRIHLQEIRVAALEDWILPACADAAGALAVPGIERVGDVHPFDDAGERDELLVV